MFVEQVSKSQPRSLFHVGFTDFCENHAYLDFNRGLTSPPRTTHSEPEGYLLLVPFIFATCSCQTTAEIRVVGAPFRAACLIVEEWPLYLPTAKQVLSTPYYTEVRLNLRYAIRPLTGATLGLTLSYTCTTTERIPKSLHSGASSTSS